MIVDEESVGFLNDNMDKINKKKAIWRSLLWVCEIETRIFVNCCHFISYESINRGNNKHTNENNE